MKRANQVDRVNGSLSLAMGVIDAGLQFLGPSPDLLSFKDRAEELQAASTICTS